MVESRNIEYKSDLPKNDGIKRVIVSFLNLKEGEEGTILLGVNDNGEILEDKKSLYKDWEDTLSNWIVNAFSDDASQLIRLYPNEIPFRVSIKGGGFKPYYVKKGEGFSYENVYVRRSSKTVKASKSEIQKMMLLSAARHTSYEELKSPNQDLTFDYLKIALQKMDLSFSDQGLRLRTVNGLFNMAALILSDQNTFKVKIGHFKGLNIHEFIDRSEYTGSIIYQIDQVLSYLQFVNKTKAVITGERPQRDEIQDYPPQAIREAVVNAFAHRDYSIIGDITIEIFDDRLSIQSPGSLPDRLSKEAFLQGARTIRNYRLNEVLQKLLYMENYATGIRRIMESYKLFSKKPDFLILEDIVKVTLYNKNYYYKDSLTLWDAIANTLVKKLNNSSESLSRDDILFILKRSDELSDFDTLRFSFSNSDNLKAINQTEVLSEPEVNSSKQEEQDRKEKQEKQEKQDRKEKQEKRKIKLSKLERQQKILELINNNSNILQKDIMDYLNISRTTLFRDLTELKQSGKLK